MPPPSQRAAATTECRPGFQSAHLRPVVSRFGGMIQESNAIHNTLLHSFGTQHCEETKHDRFNR